MVSKGMQVSMFYLPRPSMAGIYGWSGIGSVVEKPVTVGKQELFEREACN